AAAASAAAAILAAPVHGGPGEAVEAAACSPLRVATANLYERNCCEDALWAALQAIDADLLATPELTPDMAGLKDRLSEAYPWAAFAEPTGTTARRLALWSRWPMGEDAVLSAGPHPTHVLARLRQGDGAELRAMAVHMGWPRSLLRRYGPTEDFERFREAFDGPTVVMGDFNAPPWGWAVRRVGEVAGAAAPSGWRPTWPGAAWGAAGRWLGLPIDHVLASPDIAVRRIERFALPGSDHLSMVADLCLPG
ncbi:MAG: endonuclease/exonuclease/phosphatase family protein, partial [Pseudomonadota bacterium]